MDKIKYYVIGGQYDYYCHGGAPTLTGAKRIASKCAEYWDNWQGWHIPSVYWVEDVEDVTTTFGVATKAPRLGAQPVATANYDTSGRVRWHDIK